MNRNELNASIDTIFDDNIPDYSLKPSMEGGEIKKVADYVDQEKTSLPYKTYKALLSCTDGVNVVLTVLQNTIGNIIWTRNSAGNYKAELANAFTLDKTIGFTSVNNGYYINSSFNLGFSTDILFLETYVPQANTPVDYIQKLAIEIQVYN